MKTLKEILLHQNITESLFDNDLVKKDVDIDFDTLLNMLFDFGKKYQKIFKKINGTVDEGHQSVFFDRKFKDSNKKTVVFEIELCVGNVFVNKGDEHKLTPIFHAPRLSVNGGWGSDWKYSKSDYYVTLKEVWKKYELVPRDEKSYVSRMAEGKDYKKAFEIYDKIVKYFCSDEFGKLCEKYINMFESKKCIPGLMVDKIMKEIINKS